MKPQNKSKKSILRITKVAYEVPSMISLGEPKGFLAFFRHSWRIISLSTKKKEVLSRVRLFYRFASYLLVMRKHHGDNYTIQYLKIAQLAVQKKVAGEPLKSMRELAPDLGLPRLSHAGLPAIIRSRDARMILLHSPSLVRMYSSLFSLYRILSCPGKLKINTITDPFSGDVAYLKEIQRWITQHCVTSLKTFKVGFPKPSSLEVFLTSSPNSLQS
jgi:hypothetical protein